MSDRVAYTWLAVVLGLVLAVISGEPRAQLPPPRGHLVRSAVPPPLVKEARGPRSTWKCAMALAAQAERHAAQDDPHVHMPGGCTTADLEAPYRPIHALGGLEIWRGRRYLATLAGSGPGRLATTSSTTTTTLRHRRTITREFWMRDPARTNGVPGGYVHVTEVEEEGP